MSSLLARTITGGVIGYAYRILAGSQKERD
jgi:hypothetical protein